ncbi:P1 family peptidase [Dermacoccaceae bacterium W4C1]
MSEHARPGPTNSLHDVAGVRVGQVQAIGDGWLSGVTCVLAPDGGATAGVDVRGGGPGTRETDLLDPRNLVEAVHAVVLTGGSAYGLASADGVMRGLEAAGSGFPIPGGVVPIVPAAVINDLGRGGDFAARPDASMGARALEAALAADPSAAPDQGNVGGGTGAKAGGLKGGVGSASVQLPNGVTVAALMVANPLGSPVDPSTGRLYAADFALPQEFPAMGPASEKELSETVIRAQELTFAGMPSVLATTIGVVATDATLTKAQCQKVAGVGHDGMARAVRPVHSMFDGDTVFTLATGAAPEPDPLTFHQLLEAAADCVTRAIGHAVLCAETVTTEAGAWRSYREALPSVFTPSAG